VILLGAEPVSWEVCVSQDKSYCCVS